MKNLKYLLTLFTLIAFLASCDSTDNDSSTQGEGDSTDDCCDKCPDSELADADRSCGFPADEHNVIFTNLLNSRLLVAITNARNDVVYGRILGNGQGCDLFVDVAGNFCITDETQISQFTSVDLENQCVMLKVKNDALVTQIIGQDNDRDGCSVDPNYAAEFYANIVEVPVTIHVDGTTVSLRRDNYSLEDCSAMASYNDCKHCVPNSTCSDFHAKAH